MIKSAQSRLNYRKTSEAAYFANFEPTYLQNLKKTFRDTCGVCWIVTCWLEIYKIRCLQGLRIIKSGLYLKKYIIFFYKQWNSFAVFVKNYSFCKILRGKSFHKNLNVLLEFYISKFCLIFRLNRDFFLNNATLSSSF